MSVYGVCLLHFLIIFTCFYFVYKKEICLKSFCRYGCLSFLVKVTCNFEKIQSSQRFDTTYFKKKNTAQNQLIAGIRYLGNFKAMSFVYCLN